MAPKPRGRPRKVPVGPPSEEIKAPPAPAKNIETVSNDSNLKMPSSSAASSSPTPGSSPPAPRSSPRHDLPPTPSSKSSPAEKKKPNYFRPRLPDSPVAQSPAQSGSTYTKRFPANRSADEWQCAICNFMNLPTSAYCKKCYATRGGIPAPGPLLPLPSLLRVDLRSLDPA